MSVGSPISIKHVLGAIAAMFVGIGFFFAIVGVFGLLIAIVSLALFIALASLIFRRPQAEGVPR
jgi:hypothetical protein